MDVEQFLAVVIEAEKSNLGIAELLNLDPPERTELLIAARDHYIREAAKHLTGSAWARAKQLAAKVWRAQQPLSKRSSPLIQQLHLAERFYKLPGGPRQFHRILTLDIGWYVNVNSIEVKSNPYLPG